MYVADCHGVLSQKAAGTKGNQSMMHVSAVAVQAGLFMGSEEEGTAFTSGQRPRTIRRLRCRALCSDVVWVGHCRKARRELSSNVDVLEHHKTTNLGSQRLGKLW